MNKAQGWEIWQFLLGRKVLDKNPVTKLLWKNLINYKKFVKNFQKYIKKKKQKYISRRCSKTGTLKVTYSHCKDNFIQTSEIWWWIWRRVGLHTGDTEHLCSFTLPYLKSIYILYIWLAK